MKRALSDQELDLFMKEMAKNQTDIPVPMELEQKMKERIHRMKKRTNKRKFSKAILGGFAASAAALILMINVSPAFANYINNIPVFAQIVEKLRYDKGMETAIREQFVQNASATAEDQGIRFTINNVISDEKRMIITYTLNAEGNLQDLQEVEFDQFTVSDDQNHVLVGRNKGNFIIGKINDQEYRTRNTFFPRKEAWNAEGELTGWMEIISSGAKPTFPNKIHMTISRIVESDYEAKQAGKEPRSIEGNWTVAFDIDPKLAHAKAIEYSGSEFELRTEPYTMKLKLDYAKIYPTVTALKIDLLNGDEINKSVNYVMHLEDENGKVYRHVEDGILTDSGNVLPEFESCYFEQPKELYLVIEQVKLYDFEGEKTYDVNQRVKIY